MARTTEVVFNQRPGAVARRSEGTGWYVKSLGRTPLLTAEQERRLARRIRSAHPARGRDRGGDDIAAARERFIHANVRMVWALARKYSWVEGVEMPDLVQEGMTGLIEAVERFDPDKGTRFSTYATWWILKAIRRSIDDRSRLVRLPVHVLNRMGSLRKVRNSLRADLGGREPDVEDLAAAMEADLADVQFLLDLGHVPYSLDDPVPGEENCQRGDLLTDRDSPGVEELTERRLLLARLRQALRGLSPAERRLIERRYGLGRRKAETLQSIGSSLGMTRERARQIEKLLLQVLRESRPLRGVLSERSSWRARLAG